MCWLRQLHRCGFPIGRQPMALQRSPLSDPLSGKHAAPPRSIGIGGLLRAIGLSPSISPSLSPQPNPSPKPSLSPLPSPQGNPCGHSNGDLNGKLHGTGNGISSDTRDGPNGPDRPTEGEPQVLFRLVGNSPCHGVRQREHTHAERSRAGSPRILAGGLLRPLDSCKRTSNVFSTLAFWSGQAADR